MTEMSLESEEAGRIWGWIWGWRNVNGARLPHSVFDSLPCRLKPTTDRGDACVDAGFFRSQLRFKLLLACLFLRLI